MPTLDNFSLSNYGLDGVDFSAFTMFKTGTVSTVTSGENISITIPSDFDPKMAIVINNEYNMVIAVNGTSFDMSNNFHTSIYNGTTRVGYGARDFNKRFYVAYVTSNNQLSPGTYKYILLG